MTERGPGASSSPLWSRLGIRAREAPRASDTPEARPKEAGAIIGPGSSAVFDLERRRPDDEGREVMPIVVPRIHEPVPARFLVCWLAQSVHAGPRARTALAVAQTRSKTPNGRARREVNATTRQCVHHDSGIARMNLSCCPFQSVVEASRICRGSRLSGPLVQRGAVELPGNRRQIAFCCTTLHERPSGTDF